MAALRLNIPADVIIPVGTIPIGDFNVKQYAAVEIAGS